MSIDREESLFLTVSGNHSRRDYPRYIRLMSQPLRRAGGMAAVYEGVVLGGGDRLFGLEELERWLRRYRYADYDMHVLLPIAHLCLECAVRRRLAAERPGIPAMAERAARELLRDDPLRLRDSSRGWMYICWLTAEFPGAADRESLRILERLSGLEGVRERFLSLARGCPACPDTRALVERAVRLYKEVFTRYFAPDHSRDELPLWETADDLWEGKHEAPKEEDRRARDEERQELTYKRGLAGAEGVTLSEEALAAVPEYLAKNFGPSFQTEREREEMERTVCTGIHEGRRLLLTDGLPEPAFAGTSDRAASLRESRAANLRMLEEHADAARQGIRTIEQAFRGALNLKTDPDFCRADHGVLDKSVLWKAGRCEEPRLFRRIFRQDLSTVAVDLLIDASGSQAARQPMVALQSYLFSAALSRIGLPHRVMSYCTYGDHTVLRRFRDYDDPPAADRRILEYRATSNNRDGLALAAAGMGLLRRREDHRVAIVFSDGLPNDMVSGRVRPGAPKTYVGEAAVRDTCAQVRRLRRAGVYVLGIFLGSDEELENERMIYGSSFLRIRRAEDFGGSAGKRLSEILLLL